MIDTASKTPAPGDHSAQAYAGKSDGYFAGVRQDFLELLPRDGQARVLEIGCGAGETGAAALAQELCQEYIGVEIAHQAASVARTRLTEVVEGNVETLDLPWPDQHFDAVLMSEVLEHLVDPWSVVGRVAAKLKPGALVMASSPNVAQMSVLRGLLADRWELTESGVMDRTHLRWFTQASYRAMFEDAGIRVDSIRPMARPGPGARAFNLLTFNRLRHLTVRQICIVGHKT
ncbi:class I SAM-dependent methyltransferase [Qipengyuania sp. ASV99]|uniref:class I SAM-dependent methyltransferase n=1 Tax=Qipengyuania sp. ASV99 TaxID=3399681 RepID=UPI003A4C6164